MGPASCPDYRLFPPAISGAAFDGNARSARSHTAIIIADWKKLRIVAEVTEWKGHRLNSLWL
ncbi:hypothetical protein GCM10007276_28300 [Agaricicola taiwanensis]|uniref:Uncharacterized protein n=1 Tax=Agaricicola taiwanensis TaxID=591372 RepID=A0A8J2YKX7_9RHOB|nr:hypothetical protein GCM10007276_28300 [Agaricicola taiwanensis]